MPLFGPGENHPSKKRQRANEAARDKRLNQMKKVSSSSQKRKGKKRKKKVEKETQIKEAYANTPASAIKSKAASKSTTRKKAKRKKRRKSTIELLNETEPVDFSDVNHEVANDKANRLVNQMLEALVVDDRASAIETLRCVIGKLRSKITHTDTADDPDANRAIVDTLVDALDSTLAVKGGVETDRLVTKKTILAIVAKAATDENGSLKSRIERRVGLAERAYTLCKITQAPRKSKGASKTKDCWGIGVPKGQYYVKVDDFIINDESDRLHKRTDDESCLGAICRIKKKDCIFFDSFIRVFSENVITGFVRVTSVTHDNLNGLYQQSRTAPQIN